MSSTDVKIFEKEEFGSVRVVMQGDDPWFVASDVAKSLGYDNPANAINTHCKKINKITLSPDLGGREISSKMPPVVRNIIPESRCLSPRDALESSERGGLSRLGL